MADNLHVHSLLGGEEIQHSRLTVALDCKQGLSGKRYSKALLGPNRAGRSEGGFWAFGELGLGIIADAGRDEFFTAASGGEPDELVVVVCGRPSLAPHRVPTA